MVTILVIVLFFPLILTILAGLVGLVFGIGLSILSMFCK